MENAKNFKLIKSIVSPAFLLMLGPDGRRKAVRRRSFVVHRVLGWRPRRPQAASVGDAQRASRVNPVYIPNDIRGNRFRITTSPRVTLFFEFDVESLMFDVDGQNLKPITSNIKERGTSHDDISFHVTSPYAQGQWPCIFYGPQDRKIGRASCRERV